MKKANTQRLVESALMLAIAVILELIPKLLGLQLPFGGSFTLAAMFPIILIAYRYGVRWGLVTGFVYSLLQIVMGSSVISAMFIPGTDSSMVLWKALFVVLFEYVLVYTLLGLGGIFRDKIKNPSVALLAGVLLALSIRYLIHIVAGAVIFGSWAEWFFADKLGGAAGNWFLQTFQGGGLAWAYSIIYNGLYMVPEIILTSIVALVVGRIPQIAQKVKK